MRRFKLVQRPVQTSEARQGGLLLLPDLQRVLDVFQGVLDLPGRERSAPPIRSCLAPIDLGTEDALHQGFVREGETSTEKPLGDLDIHEFAGPLPGIAETESNLFPTAMDDDRRHVVGHDLPPGAQVLDFERIDRFDPIRCAELQQTEPGTEVRLGNEFRIEGDRSRVSQMATKSVEVGLFGNQPARHHSSNRQCACRNTAFGEPAEPFVPDA